MQSRKVEISVGLFMVLVICAIAFLCFKVTDVSSFATGKTYRVYAIFDNIGGLKSRSPIKIGGVVIGRIANISLEQDNYRPYVALDIDNAYSKIPSSSSLSIKTSGLLGEQFIDVNLGVEQNLIDDLDMDDARNSATAHVTNQVKTPDYFIEGFVIQNTKPAVVLEDLIGQFLYNSGDKSSLDESKKEE